MCALSLTGEICLVADTLPRNAVVRLWAPKLESCVSRSGSMLGSKLQLVKEATNFMVQQLSSVDRLSVVSFDHEVRFCCQDSKTVLASKSVQKLCCRY